MADTEFFVMGTVVCVTPVVGDDITGEVMAFDQTTRILILKLPASNKKSNLNDVSVIFTNKVKNITAISEPDSNDCTLPSPQFELNTLRKKYDKNYKERNMIRCAYRPDVSGDAQEICLRIAKCSLATCWSKDKAIIVMDEVAIIPPYKPDCVRGCNKSHQINECPDNSKMIEYITKMVERHYDEKRHQQQQVAATDKNVSTDPLNKKVNTNVRKKEKNKGKGKKHLQPSFPPSSSYHH